MVVKGCEVYSLRPFFCKYSGGIWLKVCRLLLTFVCLTGFGTSIAAADADHIIRITARPIIVTAYKNTGPYGGAGLPEAQTTVVTDKEISANNYKSVEEVLRQVNGVSLNSMVPGISSYVRLNGDDRVNVLVDGQSLANAQGAGYGRGMVDLSTLPGVEQIARIEIVKGAGSVRYGAGAVGGTINIITKKGRKDRTVFDIGGGSWGQRHYGLTQEGSAGSTSWFLTGDLDKRGYYKFPHGAVTDKAVGDTSAKFLTFRLDRQLSKSDSLTFGITHKTAHGHAVTFKQVNHQFKVSETKPLERLINNYNLTYRFRENTSTPGFIRYFNDYSKTRWTNRFHARTQGLQAELTRMNAHNFITAGLEWTQDSGSNDGANYQNKKKNNRAVYAEDMIVYGKWSVTPGIRMDKNSAFGFHKTPRLSVEYRADADFNLFASWSRVYTPPRLNDMYYYKPAAGPHAVSSFGNPYLRPETGYSQTIGFDWAYDKKSTLRFSAFHSSLNDAIRWDRASNPKTVRNLNREDKRGIDVSLQHRINKALDWELGYTYTKTKTDEGRGMRPDRANNGPNGYRAALRYHCGKWRANLQVTAGTGRDDTYYFSRSYVRWDLNASYEAGKNTTVYAVIRNLNDDSYDLYHGYPDAGRNWTAGVKYTF